jgi:hypothetical protein
VPSTRKTIVAAMVVLIGVSIMSCRSAHWAVDPSAAFFPLKPRMMWTYRVESKSQRTNYVVTDMVVGSQYVPALKITGDVVEEFYNLDRAGLRPIVYVEKGGYLTRLSGLDYVQHQIKGPVWGRSIEEDFLPEHLTPDRSWSNKLFPYGRLPGSFDIVQNHKSFRENGEITVPAGRFHGCIRIETQARYEGGAYEQQKMVLKLSYLDWYAPNVGLIRTVAYQGGPDGPEMERVELLKFNPATKATASAAPAESHS